MLIVRSNISKLLIRRMEILPSPFSSLLYAELRCHTWHKITSMQSNSKTCGPSASFNHMKICARLGRIAHQLHDRAILADDIHVAVDAEVLAGAVTGMLVGAGIGVGCAKMRRWHW